MTSTQKAVLRTLSHIQYKRVGDIAERITYGNRGGAARSLRSLMTLGLVEQVLLTKTGSRWKMYAYRLARKTEAA